MPLYRQKIANRIPSLRHPRPLILGLGLAFVLLLTVVLILPWAPYTEVPGTAERSAPPFAASPVAAGHLGRRGTLSEALARLGAPRDTAHRIATALREMLDLRRLRPGDRLELHRAPDGQPSRLVYTQTPLDVYEVAPWEEGWRAAKREIPVERRVVRVAGDVTSSLFESLEALGEPPQLVLDFVEIFAWTFDFNQDSQPGDQFRILVEKLYTDGAFVKNGRIVAAEYESEGATHAGIFFAQGDAGAYYTPAGEAMRRAFLRSPLEFTRISSGYSRGRRHPILGGVRPHLAVDYAAPAGTPVWAVADGVVEYAGWKGGNGLTVTLRHRADFKTMYNHLSRLGKGIRRAARVRQRQVIGFVGSTGLSTGPHLDYRVVRNGRFVDPLRQTFLPGAPIHPQARAAFEAARDRLLRELRNPAGPEDRRAG